MKMCFKVNIYDGDRYIFSFYEINLEKLIKNIHEVLGKTNYDIRIYQVEKEF